MVPQRLSCGFAAGGDGVHLSRYAASMVPQRLSCGFPSGEWRISNPCMAGFNGAAAFKLRIHRKPRRVRKPYGHASMVPQRLSCGFAVGDADELRRMLALQWCRSV